MLASIDSSQHRDEKGVLYNFKEVNDNYGHDNGDLVLMRVAEVLQSCFRKSDCIGRLGGDEFVIYVDASFADDVLDSKLQEVIYQVVELARRYPMSNLSVSIGGCRCKKGTAKCLSMQMKPCTRSKRAENAGLP